MYSLDINFLNDRPDIKPDKRRGARPKLSVSPSDRRPLFIGVGVLIAFPVLAGALWGVLTLKNSDLEKQQADLDVQLGTLETEKKNLSTIQEQAKKATEEAQALATVFNQLKPWSAMAQDIRDRLPVNIQLASIKQIEPTAATGAPNAASSPASSPVSGRIEITGLANSFNDVNDFLLTLQQSNFLKASETKVVSAELNEAKTLQLPEFPGVKREGTIKPPKLPRKVKFVLTTALNEVPASDLVRELDRKGAIGLVTRIEALKERGVIQSAPAATPKNGAKTP